MLTEKEVIEQIDLLLYEYEEHKDGKTDEDKFILMLNDRDIESIQWLYDFYKSAKELVLQNIEYFDIKIERGEK